MSGSGKKKIDPKIRELEKLHSLNPHPEKVTAEIFGESEFFDPRDLVQVKYEMLRTVDKGQQSVANASSGFGFARRSFYQIKQSYDRGGISALSHKKRGPKGRHKLADHIVSYFIDAKNEDESLTLNDIRDLLKSEFGVTVHIRSIQRAIAAWKKN